MEFNTYKDIFMSADTLFQSLPGESEVIKALSMQADGIIQLPAGTLIGGVNPGTIVIKGVKDSTADLPQGTIGDGYIVDENLNILTTEPSTYTDVGKIRGPRGFVGDKGSQGFQIYWFPGFYWIPGIYRFSRIYWSTRIYWISRGKRIYRFSRIYWSTRIYWSPGIYWIPRIYWFSRIYWCTSLLE